MTVEQSHLDDDNTKYISNIETGSQEDKAFGCFFGLLIGWYAGVQISSNKPTREEVEKSL